MQSRLELEAAALRAMLAQRPDLLKALGFLHVPGRRLFDDAAALLKLGQRPRKESFAPPRRRSSPPREALAACA